VGKIVAEDMLSPARGDIWSKFEQKPAMAPAQYFCLMMPGRRPYRG
jgi:hypothetical protein